jgi:DNA-binding winged helix-turn-helix (wHTH) protein
MLLDSVEVNFEVNFERFIITIKKRGYLLTNKGIQNNTEIISSIRDKM